MKKAKITQIKANATIIIAVIACVVMVVSLAIILSINEKQKSDYHILADELDLIQFVDMHDLTYRELTNRNGKLIIERIIGVVDNASTGAGHVIHEDVDYYISYKGVDGIQNGNIICSFFVYNPSTNYDDDVLMRFDYVIDSMAVE